MNWVERNIELLAHPISHWPGESSSEFSCTVMLRELQQKTGAHWWCRCLCGWVLFLVSVSRSQKAGSPRATAAVQAAGLWLHYPSHGCGFCAEEMHR